MRIEMEDRSGQMRDPEDFIHAREIVIKRMVQAGGVPKDIELFMEFTTIIQALEIAAAVATARKARA